MTTLDNAALIRLARNPLLAAEFPFLKSALKRDGGCSCSSGPAFNTLKAQIGSLGDGARKKFKELAKMGEIKVMYREGGVRREVVF